MFDRDRWQEIYLALSTNKLRTFLTAFGVGWGILMLIIMLGAGAGLQNGVTSGFGNFATNSIFVWTQGTTMAYKGLPKGRYFRLDNGDITALQNNVPEVDLIAPRNQLGGWRGGNNVSRGTKAGAFSVNGDYPQIKDIQGFPMVDGRFINILDIERVRKVAVIGTHVKEVLFGDENPISKSINIKGVYFMVIGTFGSDKTGDQAERDGQTIFVPFTTFQKAFNFGNRIGWFALTAKPNESGEKVEKLVIAELAKRHKVHPEDEQAFGSFNVEKEFDKMNNLFAGIKGLSWFVGILTLIAGVIGISNIMLMIVKERTKEIGIRRALGATPASVVGEILLESVILTALAGYSGLVVGVGLLELVGKYVEVEMFKNPEVNLGVAVTSLVVLIICGLLSGLIPAGRAISIKPVEAIRSE